MAKPRKKIPEVLWRLFGHRALTLSAAVTSMVPPPPRPPILLLRRGDPSSYRDLLNHCFVVLADSQTSPPISRTCPESHWPQQQVVARTIEMIIYEQSVASNVLCSGYDKFNQWSPLVEILTSPDWCLLLERAGEEIMYFLLKNTSIFLPITRSKYHQVTGPPITKICYNTLNRTFETRASSSEPIPSDTNYPTKKRRKREDHDVRLSKRQQLTSPLNVAGTSGGFNSFSCCTEENCLRLFSCGHSQMNEAAVEMESNIMVNREDNSSQAILQKSNQSAETVKKRKRPFSWQRRRKRRQLSSQETPASDALCKIVTNHKNGSLERCGLEYSERSYSEKCTLEKQIPRIVAKGAQISRTFLFHNTEFPSSAFPRMHVLNSLRPNSSGARFLLKSIFGFSDESTSSDTVPCFQYNGFCLSASASVCLHHSLSKLLKILICRARSCQYLRLLNKHCVVPVLDQNNVCRTENQRLKEPQDCISNLQKETLEDNGPEAIKSYCQKSQVVSFVWAVCRSIVPPDLLGTATNWRTLRKNIYKFLQLRRYENFSLKQCMHGLKTSEFPFLSWQSSRCSNQAREHVERHTQEISGLTTLDEATTPIMKQRLLESWIYWLFSSVVLPLLQANFYVTESEPGKQDVFYYRKEVWKKVKKKAFADLKDKKHAYLDNAPARDIVFSRKFGFSKLRLLPKENGLRLLANLSAPSKMPKQGFFQRLVGLGRRISRVREKVEFYHFKPVNSVLRDAHAVLKGIQMKEPQRLGSSVFDYNDVYRRLCPFLIGLKSGSSAMPAIYLIASDVLKAFDSVDQNKLLSIIEDVIRQEEYTLKQSSHVLCTKKSLWVQENLALLDKNIKSSITSFNPSQPTNSILVNQILDDLNELVWKLTVKSELLHDCFLYFQECRKPVTKREILFNLNEHVKRNLLQLDRRMYLQRAGICQGSVLSSLLCSLYYGDMDKKVIFPFLEKATRPPVRDLLGKPDGQNALGEQITNSEVATNISYILLRFIDDFLFISTSKQQAEHLFSRLWRGFRDYNCYMNEDKFCANFDIGHISKLPSNRLCVVKDSASFLRWSGLLINCCTLEVQADYTKYLNNHLSSSLTIDWQGKPSRHLKAKLCAYMRPKCHPIFYDSNINSAGVVRLNIFQSFLLCAMKFHSYFRDLSYICKLHARLYLRIIENSFRYMRILIKKRMSFSGLGTNIYPILHLEDSEVEWLGLHAFVQALKRKQSQHKELLSLLTSKLLMHDLSRNTSTELNYAIDVSHSSLMWQIKY